MLTWKVPDGSDSVDLRCVECTRKDHTSNMSLFEEVDGIGWNWMELGVLGNIVTCIPGAGSKLFVLFKAFWIAPWQLKAGHH